MREIVDKHFPDNWVIPIYQGYLVDVSEYWNQYTAAARALQNNMYIENIQEIAAKHHKHVKTLRKTLKYYLKDGQLIEEYVLNNVNRLLDSLRDCNVTIRWLLLHRVSHKKEIRAVVVKDHTEDDIVDLLLLLADFE